MGSYGYLLKKELLILQRDKPALLYAILMPIILFMIVIPLYGVSFTATLSIADEDGGQHAKNLINILSESKSIKMLKPGESGLLNLKIPNGFSSSVSQVGFGSLLLEYDNTRKIQSEAGLLEFRKAIFSFYADVYKERGLPNITQSELLRFLIQPVFEQKTKPENILPLIMETLQVKEKPLYVIKGREIALLPSHLPVIIAGIMTLFALVLAPYSIVHERKVGIYERLFTLPVKTRDLILSKVTLVTGLIFFQTILVLLLLSNYYGFYVGGPMTAIGTGLLGFANAAFAILIAIASKTILQMFQLIGVTFVLQMIVAGGADPQVLGTLGSTFVKSLPIIQGKDFIAGAILKDSVYLPNLFYLILFGVAAIFLAIFLFSRIKPSR